MSEEQKTIPVDIWEKALGVFRASFKSDAERSQWERYYPSFLSHGRVGDEYVIGVAEPTMVEWFTPKYAKPLQLALQMVGMDPPLPVVFKVDEKAAAAKPIVKPETPAPRPVAKSRGRGIPSTLPLTDTYTFSNFVEGPSNSFAHAAAKAVAKNPGTTATYNPLFIYGGTGLGKTQLMQAIGHEILERNPGTSVCYITSETFLNEFINALANAALPAFRARYRKVDVLLVDDVQFIAGKANFQEEFFNTFNSLMLYNKQVVMTSDVAPRDLKDLESRLTSRFSAGMVVEIESPSYETRLAILKFKAQSTQHVIPEEVLQYIAENIRSHVRAIEGALGRVVTMMDLNPNIPLSLEVVKHLLKDSIDEEQTIKNLSVADIIQTVATKHNLTVADIKSSERTQSLVTPRQIAMYLSCKLTTNSLQNIGNFFNKTHATVYHGAQTIQKRLDVEPDLKRTLEEIIVQLGRNPADVFG